MTRRLAYILGLAAWLALAAWLIPAPLRPEPQSKTAPQPKSAPQTEITAALPVIPAARFNLADLAITPRRAHVYEISHLRSP